MNNLRPMITRSTRLAVRSRPAVLRSKATTTVTSSASQHQSSSFFPAKQLMIGGATCGLTFLVGMSANSIVNHKTEFGSISIGSASSSRPQTRILLQEQDSDSNKDLEEHLDSFQERQHSSRLRHLYYEMA